MFLPNFFPRFWRAFFEKAPHIIGLNGNDFVPALDMFNGFSSGIGRCEISFK
jgi:hypothetical protein